MIRIFICLLFLNTFYLSTARSAEDDSDLIQLHSYQPLYFITGESYSKIALSFKTKIIRSLPLYLGYSQLMLWDLSVASPYFYDINYNPIIWYRFEINEDPDHWVDVVPIEHESNGRGDTLERSWNRSGFVYHRKTQLGGEKTLSWNFKAWFPYNINPNNADITRYRGVWETSLTISHLLGAFFGYDDLTLRLYPGGASNTDPTHGGQELTLRFRTQNREFLPLAVVQIFHGYGEYLLDYNRDQWGFRAGIGF